jgi:arginine decarboxylase
VEDSRLKNSLAFEYDYHYMIDEHNQIKIACDEAWRLMFLAIFTEFGSFTVGEKSGEQFIRFCIKKQQKNDREKMEYD